MQTEPRVNILMVDDQPENLLALEAILGNLGQNLVRAYSGQEALRCLLYQDFAVILLDVQMPDMDGFEVATLIRSRERSRETPIIFLTAYSTSEQFLFRGYALGAVDYLIKPIAPNVLISKVSVFIELFKKTEALRQQTASLQQQAAQLEAVNAELQISEERFRSLSTCSPVGVFVTDRSGHCVYTNPRFEAICGFDSQEAFCQDWLQAVHPDHQAETEASWFAYVQKGHEYSQEVWFQAPNETRRWVHVRAARMLSDRGNFLGHVGTIEDITERKQAETANAEVIREQAARQEAEVANRMKDEFIAILSHELRTPLNAILGWSRLITSRSCDEKTVSNALEIIHRNATSQAKLIEDILDVSQIVRGKLQLDLRPVDLIGLTQLALETVQPLAEAKAIAITTRFNDCASLQVMGDSMRIQQVIWNLLTNAVKFTPEQGQIEIDLTVVEAEATNIGATLQQYAQIQITDTGKGIEPEFLPHVFDRFRQGDSTTTRTHGGLGLGLAIVSHLIEQHQGKVTAQSAGPNQGSTFTVKLPLLKVEKQPAESLQTDSLEAGDPVEVAMPQSGLLGPSRPLKQIRVMVIDDDDDTRNFLTFLLEAEGAVVTAASSGIAALHLLEFLPQSQAPQVLLCDISMPELDGYMLIRRVRSQGPHVHTPAIALTAHARISDQRQAIAAGFQKHLPKPVNPEALVQAIDQLLRVYA
ncbi:MAG TPA: response regulator [Leptolyngbyaceae cyanobacterium]